MFGEYVAEVEEAFAKVVVRASEVEDREIESVEGRGGDGC